MDRCRSRTLRRPRPRGWGRRRRRGRSPPWCTPSCAVGRRAARSRAPPGGRLVHPTPPAGWRPLPPPARPPTARPPTSPAPSLPPRTGVEPGAWPLWRTRSRRRSAPCPGGHVRRRTGLRPCVGRRARSCWRPEATTTTPAGRCWRPGRRATPRRSCAARRSCPGPDPSSRSWPGRVPPTPTGRVRRNPWSSASGWVRPQSQIAGARPPSSAVRRRARRRRPGRG